MDAAAYISALPPQTELYMCGSYPPMAAIKTAWQAADRPTALLRYESFVNSGAADAMPFSVTVVETGAKIEVRRDLSLLDALLSADQPLTFDCGRGECGLCKVEIEDIDDEIDHRDVFFSDEDHDSKEVLSACVSRPKGGHARIRIDSISLGRSA